MKVLNPKKIAIVGAGWYGCHLALSLYHSGHIVSLYESSDSIFSRASYYNQNRLHLGFHYPRSYATRIQSKRGYRLFLKKYPQFLSSIDMNVYAISSNESILDFKTYCDIMSSTGLDWEDVTNCLPLSLKNISGAIACEELLIDASKAKNFFANNLSSIVKLSSIIDPNILDQLSKNNDLVLDCTWNTLLPCQDFVYEPCVVLVYQSSLPSRIGLTFMDGPLFSLFPFSNNLYTLTHVSHTPLGRYTSPNEANSVLNCVTETTISHIRNLIESHVIQYFPSFHSFFTYKSHYTALKTKQASSSCDDRNTFMSQLGSNIYSVHSGKIDTIFDIEHQVATVVSDL